MSIYTHTQVQLPTNARFKISPSKIADFFSYPVLWYKSEVLGESQFTGNTASVLGTSIHYIAEQYGLSQINGTTPDPVGWSSTIERDLTDLDNQNVDKDEVRSLYKDMSSLLVNDYLIDNPPTEVESELYAEVKDLVYVGGSCDNYTKTGITSGTVVDYKSTSKKPSDKIPYNYYIQAMAYAYMYKSQGKPVDRIKLVYVVRPTKTLGVRLFEVSHQITKADWRAIEDALTIIADTILLTKKSPELTYLLFKSMQFKDTE